MLDQQALERILQDQNSTHTERLTAQRQLDGLNPKSPITDAEQRAVSLCGPLALDLLHLAGANELTDVSWRNLVRFTDSRDWPGKWENHDIRLLWGGWVLFGNGGILNPYPSYYKQCIWDATKEEFGTDEERRAEFERMDRDYPLFCLSAIDNPHELEIYERHLDCSDRISILAITRKKLDEAPEFAFRTREVAQRIIEKLTERK
jgi:hypothetical protein